MPTKSSQTMKVLSLSGVHLLGSLSQIPTKGLSWICFVVINVLRQGNPPSYSTLLSAQISEWDLSAWSEKNKYAAETLFWHVRLILPRAERGEEGCGVQLLGNISWISGNREINVIPSCYYLRLGLCVLEIMLAWRSRVKVYSLQILHAFD